MGAVLLQSLFRHKAWANEELFDALEKVDPVAHSAERYSAIRILNHIHVVDRIFAAHLCGEAHGYTATNTAETPSHEALRAAVLESDRWYVDHVGSLSEEKLAEQVTFTFTDGAPGRMSREEMLAHVITHGSYHRGAVGRILSQASVALPRDIFTAYLHRTEPQRRGLV